MPATAIPQDSVFGRISSLIDEINGSEKSASDTELGLSGEGKKDPGGYQGPSSHPSARAASNVQKTPLGSRAKENESDVKEEHPGAGVDNTDPKSGGSQDDKQYNIGTNQSATGEDPKVEDDYKGDKDDKREGDRGGTEGPFNAEDVGEKYSSLQFQDVVKLAYDKMNNVLADIASGANIKEAKTNTKPADKTTTQKTSSAASESVDPKTAAAAGYELADMANKEAELQKQAVVQATIEQTILDAYTNADLVGEHLTKYAAECERLMKKANEGPVGGAMEGETPMPPPGAEGPPGMGGPPGGMPGGAPPGAGGGPGDGGGEEGLDEIINALLDMGHTPEEIMAALQEMEGGAGGGGAGGPPPGGADMGAGPPGGGGGPPAMEGSPGAKVASAAKTMSDREVLYKLASNASERFRSGQWKMKPVQPGSKEAAERQDLQKYIIEICNQK